MFKNGCIDFLNNPHKQAAVYSLNDRRTSDVIYLYYHTGHATEMTSVFTFTNASRTSRACSILRGVDTVSPRVIIVRLVRQFIKSLKSTCGNKKDPRWLHWSYRRLLHLQTFYKNYRTVRYQMLYQLINVTEICHIVCMWMHHVFKWCVLINISTFCAPKWIQKSFYVRTNIKSELKWT